MRGRTKTASIALTGALVVGSALAVSTTSSAVPGAPGTVIDDFEDGDASDWIFFTGNDAGGGGGAADDRPAEGDWYFSTGWGGQGGDSSFYGGAFRNFDESAQPTVPADPWFNVWVLNQSNATVDTYNLELTLREDTNDNGWENGSEDSIGYDIPFTSSDFDDEWTLISVPLSAFFDRGTGGNGVFEGAVDEIVIVIGGVTGGSGSVVELDLDHFSLTSGGPAGVGTAVIDDMEHGDPFNNGWFTFNGDVGGGGINPNDTDVPPIDGGAYSLQTGWGSGGTAGFYGGFGRTAPTDGSGTTHFNFWINPNPGQEYTLEINLQDDDNGDGAANPADDDEFQFNCVVSATGPCAVAGGGWQLVSLPLADFFDDNSFFTGGNGILDPTPSSRDGNGELINTVFVVIGTGTDANFLTDNWVLGGPPAAPAERELVDDFESPLPSGTDANGNAVGFFTFQGAGSSVAISTATTPPAPVLPEVGEPNSVLQIDYNSTSFAGFIHAFTNEAADTWVSQDWSTREGISFWYHGKGTGAPLFIDILDNRNPGSTVDDAERWTVAFTDDFVGWKLLEFPFSLFDRKEIGNGAPNDGLGLIEMWGYALGALNTGGDQTYFVDEVAVYGIAEPPALAVQFAVNNTFIEEGTTGPVAVKLNRPIGPDDPDSVSIDYATERSYATPFEEFTPTSGTLTFERGGASELSFDIETFDDTKFEGNEQIVIRLTNPVNAERGPLFQGSAFIEDNDPLDPDLLDDFEQGPYLWDTAGLVDVEAQRSVAGTPDARPGQDEFENVGVASVPMADPQYDDRLRSVNDELLALLPTGSKRNDQRIKAAWRSIGGGGASNSWLWNDGWLRADRGHKAFGSISQAVRQLERVVRTGRPESATAAAAVDELASVAAGLAEDSITLAEFNGASGRRIDRAHKQLERGVASDLAGRHRRAVNHYRKAWTSATLEVKLMADRGESIAAGALIRDFPLGQDWSDIETLDFWFNGTGSGEDITLTLRDNRAPDPGPTGWELAWADEFNEEAGTRPNPANWAYEIGDTTPDGKNGWGNEELQYYTDDPANAATDGNGNLVITLDAADPSLECYYGPCEYTSARLITQHRAEFAYGRIESRLLVPDGGDGLWPAFWSLGTDITANPWPAAGEIDIMEYVSRLPNEIFGTIHGPGYAGGDSFGGIWDFGERVDQRYHTFVVEWEPGKIRWYVDDILYHEADPSSVAPNPWVFEKPFFLLLNFAIGGNFGGPVGDVTPPQEYAVDYVRVYQAPDTAERFETTFTDDVAGWRQVSVPLTSLVRSADQPAGAPDDGLTLSDVWGYELALPAGFGGEYGIDFVQRVPFPPPSELVVTNADDSGPGSLREALSTIADGGTITVDPALAGGTINLSSQLDIDRSVTVDASAAAPLTISAGGTSRVVAINNSSAQVTMTDVVLRDGAAAPQGGGVYNLGSLTLERALVTQNTENGGGPDFRNGGGGIYNGDGATLNLIDSTVSNNTSVNNPAGGIYGAFGSTVNITRSTVNGNLSGDVAGGLRSLGNSNVVNSTFSGNTSTAWHGGGIFHTDGQLNVTNSTFTGNIAPPGTASGIVVATFGAPANLTLTNSVMEGNGGALACFAEGGAAATITSGGGNVANDGSCLLDAAGDQPSTDALLGPLADNGGPTLTHALGAGSPAIDAALAGACPATDQRGVARPLGAGCDAGAVEQS